MSRLKIVFMIFIIFCVSFSYSQTRKRLADVQKNTTTTETVNEDKGATDNTKDNDAKDSDSGDKTTINTGQVDAGWFAFQMGGVFGATTMDGKNYQQMGLRPEIRIFKLGFGLDINLLLDENGKVREEDWNEAKDYIDKVYYVSWGKRGEPLYLKYGGLESTTLGYGTLINGYSNLLEYPTYKRQGLEMIVDTTYTGMEVVVNNFKELAGDNPAVMGGGRIYVKPFSLLQIGGSIAGDLNEYKGLRDSDGDGYPDEIDQYPYNDKLVTKMDKVAEILGIPVTDPSIQAMVNADLIDPESKDNYQKLPDKRSRTGFWSADAGLNLVNTQMFGLFIYTQFSKCLNTGGWGYTAPGVRITSGSLLEIYADYRQQSDNYIFGYYNDTYDLERAKYIEDGTTVNGVPHLKIVTKKEKLDSAIASKGYFAGLKLNILNIVTGKLEYQNLRWGEDWKYNDKSIKGELALNKNIFPLISKAKGYYVQNNVEKLQWKTESTVLGGVVGLGVADGVSIDFNYLITYQDKNGDGKIKGSDEENRTVSVSTNSMF